MTARMRGNMTVNAGEFSAFLKELVNTGYIKISTGLGAWEKDIFRATTFIFSNPTKEVTDIRAIQLNSSFAQVTFLRNQVKSRP